MKIELSSNEVSTLEEALKDRAIMLQKLRSSEDPEIIVELYNNAIKAAENLLRRLK